MNVKERVCNRTACKATFSGRWWWNPSTLAWYCQPCAFKINDANPNLCVAEEDLPSKEEFLDNL